jgi:O-antigen biosynthesis protein WbqP
MVLMILSLDSQGGRKINGRDELPIEVKAKLDGEYAASINFTFDIKVFFKTLLSVVKSDGVREGIGEEEVTSNTKGVTL